MRPLDQCRLYAFIDSAYLAQRDPLEIARQLCDGGADLIQLRAKDWSKSFIQETAERVLPILNAANVGLVINDHPDIARATGAACCHLGQEDFFDAGFTQVSQIVSPSDSLRIGLSTHAPPQAERALRAGADYLAIGPVFPTGTKPGVRPVTLEYVRWAAAHVDRPWFAIGGITLENIDAVREAGARRVCIVSAILRAPDPAAACRVFRRRIAQA